MAHGPDGGPEGGGWEGLVAGHLRLTGQGAPAQAVLAIRPLWGIAIVGAGIGGAVLLGAACEGLDGFWTLGAGLGGLAVLGWGGREGRVAVVLLPGLLRVGRTRVPCADGLQIEVCSEYREGTVAWTWVVTTPHRRIWFGLPDEGAARDAEALSKRIRQAYASAGGRGSEADVPEALARLARRKRAFPEI